MQPSDSWLECNDWVLTQLTKYKRWGSSSGEWKLLEETDAFCLFLGLREDVCWGEDWLELLEPTADQDTEGLLGVPLPIYPEVMEDSDGPGYQRGRSGPRATDSSLAAIPPEGRFASFGWTLADPGAESSTTVRALGWAWWIRVALGPSAANPTSRVAAIPL